MTNEQKKSFMINGLSLFSGIGGIDVALSEWVRPIAYCEIEPYCQSVLLQRMQEGHLPKAPIWDDIRTLTRNKLPAWIDVIYGGFPCQDISVAGAGKGLEGERSGLFFEIMRLVREVRPSFVFLENVSALRTRGLDTVIKEFDKARYDVRWTMLRASDVGAIHRRERIFILAHDRSKRIQGIRQEKIQGKQGIPGCENVRGYQDFRERSNLHTPKLCRSSDGIRNRMERTHAIGNSVCPQQTKLAFERLIGIAYN